MTTQPFFSIVIPTRGRPKYLRDALHSALNQDFADFEVVLSDNYNDEQTQAVLDEFRGIHHLRCIRTDRLLNMPDHWDFATQHARGQYVTILTDRSVLKKGALRTVHAKISSSDTEIEVCSWRWSLYDDVKGIEYADGFMLKDKDTETFPSKDLAQHFVESGWVNGQGVYVYCIPRGLNSCYKSTLMRRIRDESGTPFRPLSPDYYSAFALLGTAREVLYFDQSLVIFQGQADSQGGRSMSGIDTGYLDSLGLDNIYAHVPIKLPLVKSLIFEDFLTACDVIGGNLKDVKFSWPGYFENCYHELLTKKAAGILDPDKLNELFAEWDRALAAFDQPTQNITKENVQNLAKSFKIPAHILPIKTEITIPNKIDLINWIKKMFLLSPLRDCVWLANHNTEKWQSVLKAAGF